MARLHDGLSRVQRGQHQCAAIVGPAGIGKTRLLEEFCTVATLNGLNVVLGTPEPHDIHRPFGLFTDLYKRLLDLLSANVE